MKLASIVDAHPAVKHWVDGAAVSTAWWVYLLDGVPWAKIAAMVSVLYLLLQAAYLVWKWRREARA